MFVPLFKKMNVHTSRNSHLKGKSNILSGFKVAVIYVAPLSPTAVSAATLNL